MKKILILLLLLISIVSAQAATYYVSATGSDSNNGTSTGTPWQTLSKVSGYTFSPGDQVLFKKGDTFYGSLTVHDSGNSSNPIVYGAYGTGANPVLTGFTLVSSWTNLGSNIWESTSAVSALASDCNMVTIGGVNTPMGRTPNLGTYYTVASHSSNASITCSALTGTPNWTGSHIVMRKEDWIWQKSLVTSQSGGTVSYTDLEGTNAFTPEDGYGFFFQNDARTLDQQNEWFYDTSTKKIKVYSTAQPVGVKIATVENIITVQKNYITIQDMTIDGANTSCIWYDATSNLQVLNCSINHGGLEGIRCNSYCTYYTIDGNTIKNCGYAGIFSYQSQNNYETLTNNTMDSCTMIIGIGRLYAPGTIFSNANNTLIQYNRIDHSGYDGIMVTSDVGQVKNNYISNSLLNRSDGGGIYTAGSNTNLLIQGNIVTTSTGYLGGTNKVDPDGVGIYLDLNTTNTTVDANIVTGCLEHGIFMHHHNQNNTISNNISFDNGVGQLSVHDYTSTGLLINNTVTGNKFIARTSTQRAVHYRSALNDIPSFFSLSNNNMYGRPVSQDDYIRAGQPDQFSGDAQYMNLTQWQAFSGHDAASTVFPVTVTSQNNIVVLFNETKNTRNVSIPFASKDINDNSYSSSVSLSPFTGIVLYKDTSAPPDPQDPSTPKKPVIKNGKYIKYNNHPILMH